MPDGAQYTYEITNNVTLAGNDILVLSFNILTW